MSSPLKAILLGVVIGLAGLIASPFSFFLTIEEDVGLGLLFKLRGAVKGPSEAVVISIDRVSSEHLDLPDNPDKWPRSIHARLTETLIREGAEVIAFDVHFIEAKSPEHDIFFAEMMGRAGNVVLGEPVKLKEVPMPGAGDSYASSHNIVKIVQPIDLFVRSAAATAPFTLPRIPFKVNQYWTFESNAGDSPTMPVVVLQLFSAEVYGEFTRLLKNVSPESGGSFPGDSEQALRTIGVKELMKEIREIFQNEPNITEEIFKELDRRESFPGDGIKKKMLTSLIKTYGGPSSRYINFYGPPGTVTTIPYYKALQINNGRAGDEEIDLKGKAVFVGISEVLLAERKDSFYTVFSQANGTFISGVEIMATAFLNHLSDSPLKPMGLIPFILIILLWGIFAGVFCRLSPIGVSALGIVGFSVLYLYIAEYQFKTNYAWYPIVIPLFFQGPLAFFGAVVWNYIEVNKERQNIRKAFEHYLPKDVVNQLAKDVAHIKTGSRVVYGVCMFTDAQDYSTLSENLDPHELSGLMNRYFETMFKPVKQHGGCVSGLIGDAMLALWVAAQAETVLREKSCFAAVDIDKNLQLFKQKDSDPIKLKTRIGLHYGQISLGHIGALDHYEYTPMGDIVNTASRIEGLNKHLGTNVLVSQEVIHQLDSVVTRELGSFRLKGKKQPIVIHELLYRFEKSDDELRNACAIFAGALDAFRRQSWDEAIEKFRQSMEILEEDGPSLFYIGLCENYKNQPPEEPWNGVVRMDKK
jgi:adenylate cyclase